MSSPDTDADRPADDLSATVETEWLWFGLALAILHLVFLVVIVGLLQIDPVLGLTVGVTLSVAGGIGIMLFVFWWR